MTMRHVFISYRRESDQSLNHERALATFDRHLRTHFDSTAWTFHFAKRRKNGINAGDELLQQIERNLDQSDMLVAIVTPEYAIEPDLDEGDVWFTELELRRMDRPGKSIVWLRAYENQLAGVENYPFTLLKKPTLVSEVLETGAADAFFLFDGTIEEKNLSARTKVVAESIKAFFRRQSEAGTPAPVRNDGGNGGRRRRGAALSMDGRLTARVSQRVLEIHARSRSLAHDDGKRVVVPVPGNGPGGEHLGVVAVGERGRNGWVAAVVDFAEDETWLAFSDRLTGEGRVSWERVSEKAATAAIISGKRAFALIDQRVEMWDLSAPGHAADVVMDDVDDLDCAVWGSNLLVLVRTMAGSDPGYHIAIVPNRRRLTVWPTETEWKAVRDSTVGHAVLAKNVAHRLRPDDVVMVIEDGPERVAVTPRDLGLWPLGG